MEKDSTPAAEPETEPNAKTRKKSPAITPGSRYVNVQTAKVWEKRYRNDGTLLYEGFTVDGKPFGAGTLYWPNGLIYQEGFFDIKGLISGREYYPTGVIRFEGTFQICHGYGPNFPCYGSYFDKNGNLIFDGVGWPKVMYPKNYEPVEQSGAPKPTMFRWEDGGKHGTYPEWE